MDDLISRAEAIKAMYELEQDDIETYGVKIPEGFDGERAGIALFDLPPAKPYEKLRAEIVDLKKAHLIHFVSPESLIDVVCEIIDKYRGE